jgi:polysaccharide chain length determinant protein (PEP-CTERM system associated)
VTDADRQKTPLELGREVWHRRKWLALAILAAAATATVSLIAFLPDIYQSRVTVLVDQQQVPEMLVRSTVTSALETRLQAINQEILSRSRLEGLIQRFGLYPQLRGRLSSEELIQQMRDDIRLDLRSAEQRGAASATIAFTITYRGQDSQTVALVTNTLASFYIEENLKARERQATGTADFLRVQLTETKAKLDVQEQKVSEFKKRFVGQLPQELEVNLATLQRLNAQLNLNSDSQTRILERREIVVRQMAEAGFGTPTGSGASAGLVAPIDPRGVRLARLRQELAELRTRYSEKYPDVVRLKAELAALEADARAVQNGEKTAEAPAALPSPPDPQLLRMQQAVAEADAELRILRVEDKRLREAIGLYQQRVQETPVREQQFKELTRDYDSTKELYASLLKRYAESQISESMEQRQKGEQFRIIEPAIPAQVPAAPNRPRLLGVGLALAVGVALGAVILAEHADTSFHTVDDLRAFTRVPILARIPRIVTAEDQRRRRRRLGLAAVGALIGLILIVGTSYGLAIHRAVLLSLISGRAS